MTPFSLILAVVYSSGTLHRDLDFPSQHAFAVEDAIVLFDVRKGQFAITDKSLRDIHWQSVGGELLFVAQEIDDTCVTLNKQSSGKYSVIRVGKLGILSNSLLPNFSGDWTVQHLGTDVNGDLMILCKVGGDSPESLRFILKNDQWTTTTGPWRSLSRFIPLRLQLTIQPDGGKGVRMERSENETWEIPSSVIKNHLNWSYPISHGRSISAAAAIDSPDQNYVVLIDSKSVLRVYDLAEKSRIPSGSLILGMRILISDVTENWKWIELNEVWNSER